MKKIYSILVTIVFLILTASCNENFEIADKADSLVSVATVSYTHLTLPTNREV